MKIALRHSVLALTLGAAAVAAACGGSNPPAESAPAASATPPAPAESASAASAPEAAPSASAEAAPSASAAEATPPAAPAWADMTMDQKKELMKTQVIPQMKEAFQGFDAKRFADFHCGTCHGPGAKEGKFDMPNPKLPKLDPKDNFAKQMKKMPAITKFMMETVSPTMAKILGIPPFNPETHQGFGCFNCHTMAKK